MKKLYVFVFLTILLHSASAVYAGNRNQHRVMTCNIRITGLEADAGKPGRPWEERRDLCADVIRSYNPDIICMQEVIYDSYDYMKSRFKDYFVFGFSGPEMDPYEDGYHFIGKNVIFFKKSRYDFVSAGNYWLSETPLVAGSCSWETNRARHCNWVRIRDRRTGQEFRVLDVHLDHKSEEARCCQSHMIVEESAQYADDFPQILCGDFNAGLDQKAVTTVKNAGWTDAYEALHTPEQEVTTCHLFMGENRKVKKVKRIDFIFFRGNINVKQSSIVKDSRNGIYPSDHYFVLADLEINSKN